MMENSFEIYQYYHHIIKQKQLDLRKIKNFVSNNEYTDSPYLRQFNCDPFFRDMPLMDFASQSISPLNINKAWKKYVIGKGIKSLWKHDRKRSGKFY